MENTKRKLEIDERHANGLYKRIQAIIDDVSNYLSSIEIFYGSDITQPCVKGTELVITHGYMVSNGIFIAEMEIGGLYEGREEDLGYPHFWIKQTPESVLEGIDSAESFCSQRMLRVDCLLSGLPENRGMCRGSNFIIRFPMYFCDFTREKNGFTVKVCTREELIENYEEIAEYFCGELW